jgi:hypothetical protein
LDVPCGANDHPVIRTRRLAEREVRSDLSAAQASGRSRLSDAERETRDWFGDQPLFGAVLTVIRRGGHLNIPRRRKFR